MGNNSVRDSQPYPLTSKPAGEVVVAQGVDPTTLDPQNQQETVVANLAVNIFDFLLERNHDLRIVLLLAQSYRKVAPTVWEFKLRTGVRFHNGEPFDAEAVKFSLERLVDPLLQLRQAAAYAPLSHVEIMGRHTVHIHTKAPWPVLETMMTTAPMLAPRYYREKDLAHVATNPVGSGPFKFRRWFKNERIELEGNEHYWRSAPKIGSLIFRAIPDDVVRVGALLNGEIDIAINIPPHLADVIASHPRLVLAAAPSVRTIQLIYYIHQFDAEHKLVGPYPGPLADRRVRMAVNYAIDVDEIIGTVLEGKGVRVATMLTPRHFGFDHALRPIKQDLAKSMQLLTEAGYPNGVDIVLNSPRGRYARDKEVAETVALQLGKAGIRATVRTHEWSDYLKMAYRHTAGPVWLFGWGTTHYDAETMYVPLFRSGKPLSNYYNPAFDAMVDEAQMTMDSRKRLRLYHTINRLWIEDAVAMPLYQQIDLYGISKRVVWKPRGDERVKGYGMARDDTK